MVEQEGTEKLFFELASDSRLKILRALQLGNLKMQEVARRLDVTATEAFRQLERLSAALLVERQPEGTYGITHYGRLVLQLSEPMDFVFKYRAFFSTHDLTMLPAQLMNRLNELSSTTLVLDTMASLNRGQRIFLEAEEYGWGMAEGVIPEFMGPIMDERITKGLKARFLVSEQNLHSASKPAPEVAKNLEIRGLPEIPAIAVLTEKEAAVCFRSIGGKIDYAGFYGKDELFRGWVRDLFLYFWGKGRMF